MVRTMTAARGASVPSHAPMTARKAEKAYICPGCSTAVLPGIAHLVVWADDHIFGAAAGLAERRHWHTNCWTSRNFRYR